MTAARIAVIVPMKPLSSAKSRLSPALNADERGILSLSMLRRVLLAAAPPAERIWVVGGDDLVREVATSLGAAWSADQGAELNAALEVAFSRAAHEKLCAMYLPADLPLVDADDVRGMIDASRSGRALTLAPASRDGGTNGIIVPLGSRFRPALGQGSFERHRAQASRDGVEPVVFTSEGLGLDLDVPADLEALERLRPGRLKELLTTPGENPTVGTMADQREPAQPCPRRHE